jgi:predicted metal-dependent peptidase
MKRDTSSSSPRPVRLADEQLRAAIQAMIEAYPYHAALLAPEWFSEDETVQTMAVSARHGEIRYFYSPKFVLRCSPEELQGVLHHEVNHIVFGHVFAKREDYPDQWARTVATEVTVNEYVPEPLPGSPLTLHQFPDLPPNEDTDTRYRRLAGKGEFVSPRITLDDHNHWEGGFLTQAWNREQRQELLRRLRNIGPDDLPGLRPRFRIPGIISAQRVENLGKAKPRQLIPWERVLRDVAGGALEIGATFSRPSRRVPELVGIVPAEIVEPTKPRILAVIDTSASMDRLRLEHVAAELRHLARIGPVTVIECDKKIRAKYAFRSDVKKVHGRGGTDLRPALESAVLRETRARVVVYFTDGGGEAPSSPPRVPLIWCLTPDGSQPAKWGRVVKMAA